MTPIQLLISEQDIGNALVVIFQEEPILIIKASDELFKSMTGIHINIGWFSL